MKEFCENCSCELTIKYGSGRFCSQKCARGFSTKARRKEINAKVSKTLQGRDTLKEAKTEQEYLEIHKRSGTTKSRRTLISVKGDRLDITKGELEKYFEEHPVCEICGKKNPQGFRLCRDHDHNSKEFRGVLCFQCNRALGWFENNSESILKYLSQHSSSV